MQRVPETETKGRIHTSAATVAVMPEPEDVEVNIKPDDYRIDMFCASGPGGQHVNKTESAVRLTHYETGIVVQCQDEKSQHKNLAKALRVLKTRLYEHKREAGAREAGQRAQDAGRLRRPQPADPHLQLPREPPDRPPHRPDALQARPDHRRQPAAGDRRPDRLRPPASCATPSAASDASRAPRRLDDSRGSPDMQQTEAWTIGRLLNWTTDFLQEARADSPRLDAEVLLAHARGCQRIELYTAFDEEPAGRGARGLPRAGASGGPTGTPVAYLVGQREFFSLAFRRDARRAHPAAGDGAAR